MYAYDGAAPFDLSVAKANGAGIITGYLVGTPGGYSPINAARVAAIRAAGMGFLPNWERAANFFDTCSIADAKNAGVEAAAATAALGVPGNGSVRVGFSFDFEVPTNRFVEMLAKLHACNDGMAGKYRAFAYGQENMIDSFAAGQYPGKHWLMMSTFGLPYTPSDRNVFMVQGHDVAGNWIQSNDAVPQTDINTVTDPYAAGAWWPSSSPYAGGSMSQPTDASIEADVQHELDQATAAGQTSWAGTEKAILGTIQGLVNSIGELRADVDAKFTALQQAIAALPGGTATPSAAPTHFTGTLDITAAP